VQAVTNAKTATAAMVVNKRVLNFTVLVTSDLRFYYGIRWLWYSALAPYATVNSLCRPNSPADQCDA
ncbi:MAG: hypothetical protein AAB425_15175, partial [Bdellovibrionota bacterium]